MFEIRVICATDDTNRIVNALDGAFTAGTITVHPTHDGTQNRLYLYADHTDTPIPPISEWPGITEAYASAPDAQSELAWLCDREPHERDREWWLRRAAVVDRMACGLTPGAIATDEQALDIARRLMELDETAVICDPRAYVRQQYARWTTEHQ
ncbi:hypothetical protein ACIP6Q_28895 [Streptomyces bobili]|uniref:hypothetical protein n=1 Tax=Streptomyces bobili TaxID=67280 RepID=UPI003818424E